MASISFDGHSFFIEGRRVWLVSGVLDYAHIPRDLWRRRIRAAKHAGLNCLAVSVMWNVHEPQPGVFRFDGRADLKHFIRLIAEEGLYCILRPGPFVGGGWDAGGLPPWLSEKGSIKPNVGSGALNPSARVRQASPVFLQAVARYLDAVMDRVKDLQVTAATPGPIVLVQVEHEWFSHNPQQAEGYLEQLTRFLRESGCNVPLVNTNNLWQQVPGTIDGWDGDENVFTNCRQLRSLRHDAPCMVMSLPTGDRATWGAEPAATRTAATLVRRMAEVSAAGGMFNLDPFCGGTNFGFYAGRFVGNDDRFAITSRDGDAPLSEAGGKREKYLGVKRLATFLSQFEHVMGNLTLNHQPTVSATHLSVIHQSGTQGHVVFVIRDDPANPATRHVELSTPDGQSLPVDMGEDNVAWVLLGANLDGAAVLDVTNLRPWAFIDNRMLVMYGPAGSDGLFSIDGVLRTVTVPNGAGGEPLVISHDGLQIAILNETQIDAAYLSAAGLHVGVAGLDDDDQPMPHPDFAAAYLVTSAGKVTRAKLKTNGAKPPALPKLAEWQFAVMDSYADGSSPRFATLDGPRSLEACGADFGYGWYRVKLNRKKAGRANLLIPRGGDRLHLYQDGKLQSIIGVGPGADNEPLAVNLAAKDAELVFLADNLGRFSENLLVDQPRGIYGDLFDVKPLKLPRPEVTSDPRVDPFELNGYVPGCSAHERGPYPRYHFPVKLTSIKAKLVLVLRGERPRSVVLVNDKAVAIDVGNGVTTHHLLDAELKRGTNRITLALIDRPGEGDDARLRAAATLYDVKETLSDGADWWYARWQMPDDAAYQAMSRATPNLPTFFRTSFNLDATPPRPVMLELSGASKGQIYLNGHNAGRYFIATQTGRKVPPQRRYYLPEPWFKAGENELVLFDEHGKSPAGSKLVYDDYGPFGV